MKFSENLRAARERCGLTQQQVADRMGISKSTYCGYETEKRQPDVPKIKQLAEILNVSGDELLGTSLFPNFSASPISPADQALLDAYHRADPADRTAVDAILSKYAAPQAALKNA